jgi:ribosome biogenesis GTPase / thiamine phosphate phosphatase
MMRLDALAWTQRRQHEAATKAGDNLVPGRVVGEHRTHFNVVTQVGDVLAEIAGRLRNEAVLRSDLPGVGDYVMLQLSQGDGPAIIETVLSRTSALIRTASGERRPQLLAANVDVVFIVMALDGDFNLQRLERYLALVRDSGAAAVIVANKIDLAADVASAMAQIAATAPGIPVHAISARGQRGVDDLARYFADQATVVLIGSSGVGKSTLTNTLLGRSAQATGDVRSHDSRGRHTTTHRQMFERPGGGTLIDTPGLRGLELWDSEETTEPNFDDIEALALACKFRNCQHRSEPKCAVRAAVERGDLDRAHLAAYVARAR